MNSRSRRPFGCWPCSAPGGRRPARRYCAARCRPACASHCSARSRSGCSPVRGAYCLVPPACRHCVSKAMRGGCATGGVGARRSCGVRWSCRIEAGGCNGASGARARAPGPGSRPPRSPRARIGRCAGRCAGRGISGPCRAARRPGPPTGRSGNRDAVHALNRAPTAERELSLQAAVYRAHDALGSGLHAWWLAYPRGTGRTFQRSARGPTGSAPSANAPGETPSGFPRRLALRSDP